jgi:succinate dehydrogenase/fumarate reductase flavoprotein subunit
MKTRYDVIVVGGGGSGLAAGVSAAECGARVVLLEKHDELGGTTGIAIGSFTANRTAMQRAAGIDDDPDRHEEDAGKFAPPEIEACNNSHLRRFFLSHGADTYDWLTGMGLAFYGPSPEPPNRVPRMHNVIPNAKAYIATLQARLLRQGGTILCGTRAKRLLQQHDRVVGVLAEQAGHPVEFHATRGVVLATGDYANSPEIIAKHKGAQFARIEGIDERATGDGHLMAEQVGANLVNMPITYGPEIRFVPPPHKHITQILPARGILARTMGRLMPLVPKFVVHAMIKRLLVTWQHPENRLFDDGAILVNQRGERFCDERIGPDREAAIADQPGKICYILLDQRLIERYSRWPHFISTAPKIAYAYVEDYLRLRPDVAVAGPTLATVARRRRVPEAALEDTVRRFNDYAAGGAEDRWGRRDDDKPLEGQRWVLLGPAKAYFTTTEGGAAINERLQVLDQSGRPIPGLYAVGQIGLGGLILWGHGLHIAWALTSGRLVGQYVAAEERRS